MSTSLCSQPIFGRKSWGFLQIKNTAFMLSGNPVNKFCLISSNKYFITAGFIFPEYPINIFIINMI